MHPIAALAALIFAAIVAIWLTTPPAALPATADPRFFSAGRAMATIEAIGTRPHPVGSTEHARVRALLVARLRALGLAVAIEQAPQTEASVRRLSRWSGIDPSRFPLFNIVATWPGRDRTAPAVLLMAHYDSVWGSPGAADDGAGVATLVEDIRALKAAQIAPARDVIVLLSDGEETGLSGARRFFEQAGRIKRIGMVVNHETRGGGGRTAMFETGEGNAAAMRLFARVVPHPMVTSLSVLVYREMPNSTDLTVALKRGLPGYNFAFVGRPSLYHSPLATPGRVERAAVQDMGDQSLALVRALATAPALPAAGADATFGSLLGLATIVYPPAWGWAIVAAAAGLLAFAGHRLRRDGRIAPGELAPAIALAAFTVAIAAPALLAANALSIGWAHPNYYDRLAALHRLELQGALICAAALLLAPVARRTAPSWIGALAALVIGGLGALLGGGWIAAASGLPAALLACFLPRTPVAMWSRWLGAALLLLILTTATQIAAPTAAPLFAWPLLIAAIAMAALAWTSKPLAWAAVALLLGLALGQTLALAHFTFSGVGAPLSIALLPYLAAGLPLAAPCLPAMRRSPAMIATLLVAACLIACWVRFDPIASSVPTYLDK